MTTAYLGEIRMFGGDFAPVDWALCDGSLLAVSQYQSLYELIGTTYGGDGVTSFALPDLRGRVPVHPGTGFAQGQSGGSETVTLTSTELPVHTHSLPATTAAGTTPSPADTIPAAWGANQYSDGGVAGAMATSAGPTGGSQAHDNMCPFTVVNFIICLSGVFPSLA